MAEDHETNIKDTIARLLNREILTQSEARDVLTEIGKGKVKSDQITDFLTYYNLRPITGDELSGFQEAMIHLAVPIDFSAFDTIDVCGTGGDGKNTFNISTTSSFVIAGAGYKVAKHGNYGISSNCGSSNVLEFLGYEMSNNYEKLRSEIERSNFCYMHAPLFHPAMKEVAAVRKALQVKTFFNILGPLLNPSVPKHQLTGVFSEALMPLYQSVFENMGSSYAIVRSNDGYDEISLTGNFKVVSNEASCEFSPHDLGLENVLASELQGGSTVEEMSKILLNILEGEGAKAQNSVVCVNAGFAIQRFKPETPIRDCIAEAQESLESGRAKESLVKLLD